MPKAPKKRLKPYWTTKDKRLVRLYQGDVIAVLRELPEKSVQTVVTSPPFLNTNFIERFASLVESFTPTYEAIRQNKVWDFSRGAVSIWEVTITIYLCTVLRAVLFYLHQSQYCFCLYLFNLQIGQKDLKNFDCDLVTSSIAVQWSTFSCRRRLFVVISSKGRTDKLYCWFINHTYLDASGISRSNSVFAGFGFFDTDVCLTIN